MFCTHTQGWLFPVLTPSLIPAASMDTDGVEGRAPPHIQVLLGTSKRDLIGKQVFADVMSEDEVLLASGGAWIQGLVSVRKRGDADTCTERTEAGRRPVRPHVYAREGGGRHQSWRGLVLPQPREEPPLNAGFWPPEPEKTPHRPRRRNPSNHITTTTPAPAVPSTLPGPSGSPGPRHRPRARGR